MKNKKNFITNLSKTIVLSFFFIANISPQQSMKTTPPQGFPPPPENIEEIMKSKEFQEMVKELEEIFGGIKKEDLEPEKKEPVKPKVKKKKMKKPRKKPRKPKIKKEEEKEVTIKDHFLSPAKPKEGEAVVEKLPKEKLEAYEFFMKKMINGIDSLEKKINSFYFGIKYKEKLETLKKPLKAISSKIKTEEGRLSSKKLYRKVFFLPAFDQVRKDIVNAVEEIENIEIRREAEAEELTPEEIREREEIEKIRAIAEKGDSAKKENTYQKLKNDIKKLFEQNLSKISEDLEKITQSTHVAEILKEKEEKRKREIEEAKRRGEKYRPHYPRPFEPPFPGGPWPSWTGPMSPERFPSERYGRVPTYPAPTIKERDKKRPKKIDRGPVGEKEKPGVVAADKKDAFTVVKNLSQEILDAINEVLKIYKADDERSYQTIANAKLLSKIATKLDHRESRKAELYEKQKETLEKEIGSKLDEALVRFIPAGVRLAKYPTNKIEQQSALKIISLKEEKLADEVAKYEATLLGKVSHEPFEQYDPGKELDTLFKNITALFTEPLTSQDAIKEALEDKNITANNSKQYSQIRELLIAEDQLEWLKENIPNTLHDMNNNVISRWPTQVAQIQEILDSAQALKNAIDVGYQHIAQARNNYIDEAAVNFLRDEKNELQNQINSLFPLSLRQKFTENINIGNIDLLINELRPVPGRVRRINVPTTRRKQTTQQIPITQWITNTQNYIRQQIQLLQPKQIPQEWAPEIFNELKAASGVVDDAARLTNEQKEKIKTEINKRIGLLKGQIAKHKKIEALLE